MHITAVLWNTRHCSVKCVLPSKKMTGITWSRNYFRRWYIEACFYRLCICGGRHYIRGIMPECPQKYPLIWYGLKRIIYAAFNATIAGTPYAWYKANLILFSILRNMDNNNNYYYYYVIDPIGQSMAMRPAIKTYSQTRES